MLRLSSGVLTAETEKYDSSKGGSRPELRLRPQVEHLLSLLPYYSLGVYSSSTLKTVMRALGAFQYHLTSCAKKIRAEGHLTIPPGGVESVFQVILHRDHCIPDDNWQLRPGGQAFDTLKPLSYHGLDLTSTILVDNHAHKVFPGEERNMLVLKEWEHEADGGVLCWHMLLNQLKACAEAKDLRPLVPVVQSSITIAMGAIKHALAAAEDVAGGWPVDLTWYQASAAAVELSHLLAAAGSIKDPLPSDCPSSGTCPGSNLLPCTAGIAPDQIKDAVKASVRLAIAKRAQVDDDSTALAHHVATKDTSDYRSTAIRNTPHQQQSEAGGSARPRGKATAAAAAATADLYPELPVPQGYPSSAQALYEDMYVSACLVPQSTATAASAEEDVLMMGPAADRDHDHREVEDCVPVPVDKSSPNENAGQEPLYCNEDHACRNMKKSDSPVVRGLSLLHREVKRLALELLPTDEELEESCLQPLQMVERAVRTLSPEARVVVVGSKSCGLDLPDSDLNICIQGTVGTFQSSCTHSTSSGPKNTAASSPDNSNRVLVSQYLKRLQHVLHSMWYCTSMSVVQHPLANVSCAHKQTSFLRGMLHQTIAPAGGTTTATATAAATATCNVQKQWRAPPVWVTISVSLQQAGAHTAVAVAAANRKAAAENPVYHALVPTVKALLREQGVDDSSSDAAVHVDIAGVDDSSSDAAVHVDIAGVDDSSSDAAVHVDIAGADDSSSDAAVHVDIAGVDDSSSDAAVHVDIAGLLKVGREPGLSGHAVSLMVWAHLMCEGVVHTPPIMPGSIDEEEVRRQSGLTSVHVVHAEHGEGMIKMQPAESVQGPPGRASSAAAEAVVPPESDSAGGEVIEAVLVHEKTAATAGSSGGSGDHVEISGDASADKEKLQGCHEADTTVTEIVDEERNGVIVKPSLRHDEEMVPLVSCGVELNGHPAVKHHQSDPAGDEEAVPITVAELDVVPPAGAEGVVLTAGTAVAVWAEPAGSEGVVTVAAKMAIAKSSELAVTVGAEDVEVLREGEVIKSHVACMRQALEGRSCTVVGQRAKVDEWDLGVLLLSFMRRYGQLFRYQHDAVSLRLGGIVPRTSWAKPFHKKRYIGRIFIEDPEENGACVESCKVSFQKLRALFVKALEILTKAASNCATATDVSLAGPSSLLRHPSDNPNGHAVFQGGLRKEAGSSAEDGSCTASHIISPSFILLDSILHTNHVLATAHGRGSNHVVHLKQQGGSATSGTATAVQQMLLPLGGNWQPRSIASAAVITALLQPRLQLCTAVTASTMPAESAAAAAGFVSVSLSQENGGLVANKNNDIGESNGTCITLQRCQEDGGLKRPVGQGRPSNATTLRFQDLVVFLSHNKTQQGTQGSHLAIESQEHCSELFTTEDGSSRLLSKGDLIHARSGQDDTSAMSAMGLLRMYQARHGCKVITEESFRHKSDADDALQHATFCCHIRLLIGGSSTDPHRQHQKVLAEGHSQSAESWMAAKEEAAVRLIEELLSNGRVTLEDFLPPAAIAAEGAPSCKAPSDPHLPPVVATLTPTSVVHLGGGDLEQTELQGAASRDPASPASHEHCNEAREDTNEAREDTNEASTKAPLGANAGKGMSTAGQQSTAVKDISTAGVKDPASGCPQELDHDVHCDSSKALDKPLSRGRQEGGQDGAAKHKKRRIDNNSAKDTRSVPAGPAVHVALDAYPKCKELISWLRSSLSACMERLTGGDSPALPSLTPKVILQEWVQRKRNCQVDFLETRAVLKWPAASSLSAPTAATTPSTTAVAAATVGVAVSGGELPNVASSLPSLPRFEGTVVVRSTVTDQVLYGPMTGRANSRKGWQQDAAACLLEDLMVRLALPFSDFSRKRAQVQRTSRTARGALEGGSALRSPPSTLAVSVVPAASTAELDAAGVVENHVPTDAAVAVSGGLGREGGRDAPKHANKQQGLVPPSAHQQAASAGKRRRLAGPGPSAKVGKPLARPGESISHRDLYRQTRLAPPIIHGSTRATAAGGVEASTSRHFTLHDQQPSHQQQGPPSGGPDYPPPPPFPAHHVQASRMLPLRTPDSNQKHKNGPLGTAVQRGSKKRRQGRQPQAILQQPPGRNAFKVEKYHHTAAAAARVQGKSGTVEAGLERLHQRQQQPVASTLGQPGSAAVEYHSSAVNSWSQGMPLPAPAGSHNMEKLPGEQINTNMTAYSNLQHNHIPPQTAPATTSFHYSQQQQQQQHLAYPAALYLEQQQQYHNATAATSVTNNAHYSLLPQDAMAYPQHSLVTLNSAQAAPPSYTLSAPSPNMNSSSGYQRKYGEAEIACLQNAAATNSSGASWSGVVTNSYTPMQLPSGYNYQMTGHLGPPQVSGYHQHSALNPQPTFHNQSNVAAATQQAMAPPAAAWMWHRQ
ncbi:hypothetical protein CEUSTIGMA_g9788.t1 [Chlamydomonas eustigma]|uniref:PAP-associated domain-containing protein n=1 Tax=Chlamydomonas eustigma TaxID=1157962 RepID=A0A250XHG3_9CHLO|nr:hypothetical protein CEUSTIGMA_g9788.t1 [Chlamydomonas eustigma]|eukprot:GAX82359.1 hypothetical protein CEUSTIGMA_g9788.t1 [Chlamydomonas eustigma]